uniref:Uncharacterized protein n=1 Tax=Arundo donax TaxID=35708 RepID=A0A0A9AFT6_ARUDO
MLYLRCNMLQVWPMSDLDK